MNKFFSLLVGGFIGVGVLLPMGYLDTTIKNTQKYLWTLKNLESVTEQSLDSLRIDYIMRDATYDIVKDYNVIEDYNTLSDKQKYEINNFILPALCYEADGEPFEGVVGVAYTIVNRKNSDKFGRGLNNSFSDIITQKTKGKYEYSFYLDVINGRKPRTIPITENYYALLKIAIYMVRGKLDKLSSVPIPYVSYHRGKAITLFKHRTLGLRQIATVKESFFYATHEAFVKNDWFSQYSVGNKRNQANPVKRGNHSFLVAKKNSPLAGLL
jgi:hypothetical protein